MDPEQGAQLLNAALGRQKLSTERARLQVRLGLRDPADDPFRGSMKERISSLNKEVDQLDSEIREAGGVIKNG